MEIITNFRKLFLNEENFKVKSDKAYLIQIGDKALGIAKKYVDFNKAKKSNPQETYFAITINTEFKYSIYNHTMENNKFRTVQESQKEITGKELSDLYGETRKGNKA